MDLLLLILDYKSAGLFVFQGTTVKDGSNRGFSGTLSVSVANACTLIFCGGFVEGRCAFIRGTCSVKLVGSAVAAHTPAYLQWAAALQGHS